MKKIVDSREYLDRMLSAPRPGMEGVRAFYEQRVGVICKDPKFMLMPWDDHLVHRGDGVFEAMKWVDGKLYQLDAHIERMKRSAKAIHIKPPCSWEDIAETILDVARAAEQENGMIRVLLGRGPGGFGIDPAECPVASLYVAAFDFKPKPASFYEKGATAFKTSIPAKQPYLATIKSIDYLPNVLMKREAAKKGYDYPFCYDRFGLLAEGATENVCIVDQQGKLHIPEFTNALAGTTLMRVVDLIKDEMSIIFRGIQEHEILEAKEVIIVGTTGDAVSVVRYDGKPIHDVRPGPVAKRIRELIREDIDKNGILL